MGRFATKNNKTDKETKVHHNDYTFLDELYNHLVNNNVEQSGINEFKNFINDEQYDTESIKDDMIFFYGNIEKHIRSKKCISWQFISCIKQFITAANMLSKMFKSGVRFYYWDYYKSLLELPLDEQVIGYSQINNYNDHDGYNVSDLFITPRYASFKEEIIYGYLSIKQYETAFFKVQGFISSSMVKNIKAISPTNNPYVKHYGIEEGQPVLLHHLLSLVLWCDYTELNDDFRKTFSKMQRYETIDSIKRKNSKYYYLSKNLREVVECYGQCAAGDGDYDTASKAKINVLSGPFYLGCSHVMYVAEFNIRLCAPFSVTKNMEVATKYSGSKGMVLQFDNNSVQSKYLRGFDLSWVSRKGDNEILFFGGFYPIMVQSVNILSRNIEFNQFVYTLYYLDSMIAGGTQKDVQINRRHEQILANLFDNTLNKMAEPDRPLNEYIYSIFAAFVLNKKQIIFDLHRLSYAKDNIRHAILHDLDVIHVKQQSIRYSHQQKHAPEVLDEESKLFR
eukprot:484846_1